MNALTHAKVSRQLALQYLEQEKKSLPYADGPAHGQSQNKIANLYKTVSELDSKIEALTEAELFTKDREAAIGRAVQIQQIKMIQNLLGDCFAGSNNECGMTAARYTAIGNELYRALKELAA